MGKLRIYILIALIILMAGVVSIKAVTNSYSEISAMACDANIRCSGDLECFRFSDIGLRCAKANPCEYFKCPEGSQCVIAESYPPQVLCSASSTVFNSEVPTSSSVLSPPKPSNDSTAVNMPEFVQDQSVNYSDLNVGDPKLLPDSRWYFFKDWGRGLKLIITFNAVKKAELRLQYSSERITEIDKLVQKNAARKAIDKAIDKYQKELASLKNQAKKISDKANQDIKVNSFLNKFTRQQILHDRILDRIEQKVPVVSLAKIQEARKQHLQNFAEVLEKLEYSENISSRIQNNLNDLSGSDFKTIRNLLFLKRLASVANPSFQAKVFKVENAQLALIKVKLASFNQQQQEKLSQYLRALNETAERKIDIIEDLKNQVAENQPLSDRLQQERQQVLMTFYSNQSVSCPQLMPLAPGFCAKGRIVVAKNENGCSAAPRCVDYSCPTITPCAADLIEVIEGKDENGCLIIECAADGKVSTSSTAQKRSVCECSDKAPNPVCGEDSRTYGNECKAQCLGIKVEHNGSCASSTEAIKDGNCICAMEYKPICGKDGETYTNACRAQCAKTTVAYSGKCTNVINPTVPVIGGDKDAHGCYLTAGYSWCDLKKKCLRPWEEKCEATSTEPIVGGDKDEHGCIGSTGYSWCEVKQKCLRIWEEPCALSVIPPITDQEQLQGWYYGSAIQKKPDTPVNWEHGANDECWHAPGVDCGSVVQDASSTPN